MHERALSDLKVIEYSQTGMGAMCAKAMADLGADVVKVEPPGGDAARHEGPFRGDSSNPEASGRFLYLNANKRGVTLDVGSREGHEGLGRMLRAADVFVTDLAPRRATELKLDYDSLRGPYPRLVATYVTYFGHSGPYRDYRGSDLVAWHMGGMGYESPAFYVTDLEREPPLRGPAHQAEYLAGWTAATATLAAVWYRETCGVGQMVDVSAMEAVTNHIRTHFAIYSYDISRLSDSRLKSNLPWVWPCADGHVSTSFTIDHWWEAMKDLMGRPQWAEDSALADLEGRRVHRAVIEEAVCKWLRGFTRHELYRMLTSRGIPCFPVLSMAEVMRAPQYVARGFFVEQDHPVAGRVVQPGPPVRYWGTPWRLERPAPTLGQHNDEVFKSLPPHPDPLPPGERESPSLLTGEGRDEGEASSSHLDPEHGRPQSSYTWGEEPGHFRANTTVERNLPLKGVRVLDFGWILSVPHCGGWLGALGAEVIRVESQAHLEIGRQGGWPSADGVKGVNRASIWNGLNHSKLDVTLDLAKPEAVELVMELASISDVVMENFATGVMDRLGLGYETLRKARPDLIMISGSTLGVTGPERMASGWGPNVCSYAGQPYVSGYRGGPPVNLAGNWPDFLVGVIMAFSIMSALRCRERTGRGQYIEVSMAEVVSSMMPEAFLEQTLNGRQVERMGNHDPHMAPHNVFPCQGFDQWTAIAVGSDDEWKAFCQATGHPEWASDSRFETLAGRKLNEDELDRLVSDWTRQRAPQEVTDILQGVGIAAGPVKSIFDLMEDPHLNERGFIVEMDHLEVGRRRVAGLPARFSAMPQLAYSPAPLLGQHNSQIFGELLGIEQARLERLVKEKAIY